MDLELNEEQLLVRESVERVVSHVDAGAIRALWGRDWMRDEYAHLGQAGMLAVARGDEDSEADGAVAACVIGDVLGSHAAITPLIPSVVLASGLLRDLGVDTPALQQELTTGRGVWTFAGDEIGACAEEPKTSLRLRNGSLVLEGAKAPVEFPAHADGFVVSCRHDTDLCLVAVRNAFAGVEVIADENAGAPLGTLRLVSVPIDPEMVLARGPDALTALRQRRARARLLQAAHLVGSMRTVVARTVGHVQARVQFGRPIGSFQAAQHHLADMKLRLDAAELLVYETAWSAPRHPEPVLAALAAETKAWVAEAAGSVYRWAHELLGGLGVVDDHEISLHSRLGLTHQLLHGGPEELWRLAAPLLDEEVVFAR